MRILVNARFLIKERLEGIGLYSYEILRRMVLNQPDDVFILCFDRPYDPSFIFADNVIPCVIRPPARHPLLFIWWFDVGIPNAYKRHQADLFFSPDGFLSLSERVKKQVLVIHDLAYLHYPDQINPVVRWYYRRYMPKFIHRADRIITVSRASADDIATNFPFAKAKTSVIFNGCRELFVPLGPSRNAETKASYSGGKDYFVVIGAIHPRKNLVRILSAYQHFREHCTQDTKLLIVGRKAWKTKSLEVAYATHPNKEDIVFLGFVTDEALAQLLSAAKGLVFASLFEGFGLPIIEAMQAGVPVITSDRSAMQEISGKAALLVDPESVSEIGDAMCTLCENPLVVESIIKKGIQRAMHFSWATAAAKVWQEINGLSGSSLS